MIISCLLVTLFTRINSIIDCIKLQNNILKLQINYVLTSASSTPRHTVEIETQ